MRILLAVAVLALVATPAFAAGHNHGKLDKKIDNLNEKLFRTFVTPDEDRREDIDKLEVKLANTLFVRNKHDE